MTKMPPQMKALWEKAEANPGMRVPVGANVVCDVCAADWTERTEPGGFIFESKAYCPPCASRAEPEIKRYGEEWAIRARCPADQSFADFVRAYRGPDAWVEIR